MKNIIVFMTCLILISSSNKDEFHQTENFDNTFFEIDYEELLNEKRTVGLNQLATNVEYIKLEKNYACLINRGAKYFFADSLIFVDNRDHILKFSRNGKFLKQISSPGRGPGEILQIWDMYLLPDKREIVIYHSRALSYFSFDGQFIKTVAIDSYYTGIKEIDDGRFVTYNRALKGSEKYTFCLIDDQGDTLSVIKSHFNWVNNTGMLISPRTPYFQPFYNYRNRAVFKALYNDTVYTVNNNKIEPSYYVNLGRYKLPAKLRLEYLGAIGDNQSFIENREKYFYCNVLEASDKIFLVSLDYKREKHNFFLYEKGINHGYILIDEDAKSTGIINDWDGGFDFWPAGSVNDKQVFMPLNIISLQNELERIKSSTNNVKFPEKQQQLIRMISESDMTDNPILMIVTLN